MEYSEAEAEDLKRNAEVYAHQLQTSNSLLASTRQMIDCQTWLFLMTPCLYCRAESLPTPLGSSAWSVTLAPAPRQV